MASATVEPSGLFQLAWTEQVRTEFQRMGCAQLRDASTAHTQVLKPAPRCWTPGLKLAGPAFPVATANDMLPCLQGLDAAPCGAVLVIHNNSPESEALAGDIFVTAAREQGLGGLVVNGAVRDVDFIRDLNFPVFSTEVCFVSAKTAQVPTTEIPAAVTIGGVEIEPGDWIFGDGDGMLAIKGRFVSAVINGALLLLAEEESLKDALVRGNRFGDLCGLGDYLAGRGPLRFEP